MNETLRKHFDILKPLLLGLMDKDSWSNTNFIAEDCRIEYPQEFSAMMKVFVANYTLSGCGEFQGYINAVGDMLLELSEDKLVNSKIENGQTVWRKA